MDWVKIILNIKDSFSHETQWDEDTLSYTTTVRVGGKELSKTVLDTRPQFEAYKKLLKK